MGRVTGAGRHALKTPLTKWGMVSMYIYGGSVLSLLALLYGLSVTGTLAGTLNALLEFYIARLFPWPFDELLLAETWVELVVSHCITIGVGQLVATTKWLSSQF